MNLKSLVRSLSLATLVAIPVMGGVASAHEDIKFPVPAAEFTQKVEAHIAKRQARMDERIAHKNVPADKAAEMRAHFAEKTAKIRAEVAKITADGTVTEEEGKEFRQVVGHGHGHGHDCQGKDGGKAPNGQAS